MRVPAKYFACAFLAGLALVVVLLLIEQWVKAR